MKRARERRGLVGAALVALASATLAGCFPDATEVVVVVDTDLKPREFGALTFSVASGNFNGAGGGSFDPTATALPATVGVVPGDDVPTFDITVTMWPPGVMSAGPNFSPTGPAPPGATLPGSTATSLTSRKASHVRFVAGAQQTLFLPITRQCLCNGTSCPHALDPECKELIAPALTGFDSSHLPRIVVPTAATTAAP